MDIKLSVIIPCYNHGQYLPEALASVDKSKHRYQIEIIIINDGSTDPLTNEVIDNLDPQKYEVIKQENQGLAKSRNNGILKAKSDYVLMLDADNYIEEVFIKDFFKLLRKGVTFDALYGNSQCFGIRNDLWKQDIFDFYRMVNGNYIDACAILKKETILKHGLYDEKMPYMGYEDWEMWVKLGINGCSLLYINKVYYNYRVLENSMIRNMQEEAFIKTLDYINKKYQINVILSKYIIEGYLNRHINYKTVLLLLLKKLRILSNKIIIKIE